MKHLIISIALLSLCFGNVQLCIAKDGDIKNEGKDRHGPKIKHNMDVKRADKAERNGELKEKRTAEEKKNEQKKEKHNGEKAFAGMISGVVVAKGNDQLSVKVTKIERVWEHSRAEKPENMVGQEMIIKINPKIYEKKPGYLALVRAFFESLKIDEATSFDVKSGDNAKTLLFLELTGEQAAKVRPQDN